MGRQAVTPEVIAHHLSRILKYGAQAADLHTHARELVDIICPPRKHESLSELARAREVQNLIEHACKIELDGSTGQALLALVGLEQGTHGVSLEQRYRRVGELLRTRHIQADTVRRPYIKDKLLNALAAELYQLCIRPENE